MTSKYDVFVNRRSPYMATFKRCSKLLDSDPQEVKGEGIASSEHRSITLNALGAAMPTAIQLALALKDDQWSRRGVVVTVATTTSTLPVMDEHLDNDNDGGAGGEDNDDGAGEACDMEAGSEQQESGGKTVMRFSSAIHIALTRVDS